MEELEERWQEKCDLCKRLKLKDEIWSDTHTSLGICGFTFYFCKECERNEAACDKIMADALSEYQRAKKEYWDTHPEELAKYDIELEKYRKTLGADGLPKKTFMDKERLYN